MPKLKAEIRGMHFRPPAKEVIAVLPIGSTLRLEPEPDNIHDPNAVKVFANSCDIPQDSIADTTLANYGIDPEAFWAQPEVWIGYVAKEQAMLVQPAAQQLQGLRGQLGLGLNAKGKTVYEVEVEL